MLNRKIFPNSYKTEQQKRRQQQAIETLRQMQRIAENPTDVSQTFRQLESKAQELRRNAGSDRESGFSSSLMRTIDQIERYSRSQQTGLLNRVLNVVGVPGRLISTWLRGSEGQQVIRPVREQVQQAINMLAQMRPEILGGEELMTPEQLGGRRIPDRELIAASGGLSGGGVSGGSRKPPSAPASAIPDENKPHKNVTVIPDGRWKIKGPGRDRLVSPNDPLVTGEMIPVKSSNVHSIGWEFNFNDSSRGNLIVRYLQKNQRGGGKVAGPTYCYFRVGTDYFEELRRAGSVGKWVWDTLRIRGTIAGHQYSYMLTRAAQRYLPRRAVVRNGRQMLIRRTRLAESRSGAVERLTSPLPDRGVGTYRPSVSRPNIGNMDRGVVSRGTPNRGR